MLFVCVFFLCHTVFVKGRTNVADEFVDGGGLFEGVHNVANEHGPGHRCNDFSKAIRFIQASFMGVGYTGKISFDGMTWVVGFIFDFCLVCWLVFYTALLRGRLFSI